MRVGRQVSFRRRSPRQMGHCCMPTHRKLPMLRMCPLIILAFTVVSASAIAAEAGTVFIDRAHGDSSTGPVVTQQLVQSLGFDVAESTVFPTDLSAYSVLILDVPGWAYTMEEIDRIQQFVYAGGGLLVLGEYSVGTGQIADTVNPVLAGTGFSVVEANTGGGPDCRADGRVLDVPVTSTPNLVQQVNAGWVAAVTYPSGALPFILSGGYGDWPAGTPVAAAGSQGSGRIIVTGDNDFVDPAASEGIDSAALLQNMLIWLANEPPQQACFTSYEGGRAPFTTFVTGSGQSDTRRTPMTAAPARSGLYAMTSEVIGIGSTGLRLALPVGATVPAEVSIQTWVKVEEWTAGDTELLFGFSYSDDPPTSVESFNCIGMASKRRWYRFPERSGHR